MRWEIIRWNLNSKRSTRCFHSLQPLGPELHVRCNFLATTPVVILPELLLIDFRTTYMSVVYQQQSLIQFLAHSNQASTSLQRSNI